MKSDAVDSELLNRAKTYTLAPFVDSRGLRRSVILHDLSSAGLDPKVDLYGNIWVRKQGKCSAEDDKIVVVSSHMDTVFGLKSDNYAFGLEDSKDGPEIEGTIDNALGCAINAEIASLIDPYYTTYFLFTVGEEPPNDCDGAQGVLEIFEDEEIEPDLFIALDITYPKTKAHGSTYPITTNRARPAQAGKKQGYQVQIHGNLSTVVMPNRGIVRITLDEPDEKDQTSAYAENFSNKPLEKLIEKFIKGRSSKDVLSRSLSTQDEADIFGHKHNAFAFGPVAYGTLHSEDCTTYLENLEHCAEFLAELLTTDSLKSLEEQKTKKWVQGSWDERLSVTASTDDSDLERLANRMGLDIVEIYRYEIQKIVDKRGKAIISDPLYEFIKDFISATKKRKKEPIVYGELRLPISFFVAYAISDDIEKSDGYVHVDDSGFVSFISGLDQDKPLKKAIGAAERLKYFSKSEIDFAPPGRKPVKRNLYVPTQEGMQEVSLDIRAISPDVLYEDIYPEYTSVFEQYREAAETIMNPLMDLVSSSDVDEKEELLDILLDAHSELFDSEMVISHEANLKSGGRYIKNARISLNNFLRFLSRKAGKQSSVYLNCAQLIEEMEVMQQ